MAWNLLLTSDIGLLSLFTIFFIIGMAAYILRYVIKHIASETKEHELPPGSPRAG
ncbi:MAG TPA: DUF3149 domain-containing protein [Aromatoleum sp.]|uniref:DUF3149 domain-containing protein n=1 Tax=Aromatoleum sp. TaxID=2307007 RepID=UPI002B46B039|nr:DUF3149 domain-containing protein [Aromatoleum sp.]HJV26811.1 DUF3149 domain-containing protein [Aromatoleum sp.]